jgi:hypothetical protein
MTRIDEFSGRARPTGVRRTLLVIAAVIGLGLVAAPLAFNMFSRAPKGAVMLSDFKPLMTAPRLSGFQSEMAQINSSVHEIDSKATLRLAAKGAANARRPDASYRTFDAQWPKIHSTMTGLLTKVQGNLGNYQDIAALPSFRLFPWFFLIPGAIILALSGLALTGLLSLGLARAVLVVLGIGLFLAPVGFGMFTRAPHGAQMMSAFKDIETTQNVERIQGYSSTMAVGQGAIRNDIVPALQHSGLSAKQVAGGYPATTALDANWIHILNDMTPMIAAMSDSVPRYQAIRSLPPFTLFPWFFVIPGVLVAGLAIGARSKAAVPVPPAPTRVTFHETSEQLGAS